MENQAAATPKAFEYADDARDLDGLSLFATGTAASVFRGSCASRSCRLAEARAFSQTAALYADHIVIVDELTAMLRDAESDVSPEYMATTTDVLAYLRPMFEAGVIRFARPSGHYCARCAKKRDEVISETLEALWREVAPTLKVEETRQKRLGQRVAVFRSPFFSVQRAMTRLRSAT